MQVLDDKHHELLIIPVPLLECQQDIQKCVCFSFSRMSGYWHLLIKHDRWHFLLSTETIILMFLKHTDSPVYPHRKIVDKLTFCCSQLLALVKNNLPTEPCFSETSPSLLPACSWAQIFRAVCVVRESQDPKCTKILNGICACSQK